MQRFRALLVAMIFVAGSAQLALADDKKPADKPASGGDKGGTPKVKVFDFSGDTIEGDLIKPEGSTVNARDFAKHASLIRIRTNFIQEIIKSAEDL